MADLIDRQAVFDILDRHTLSRMALYEIEDLPSIQSEQMVIYCKDCTFAHSDCADNWYCNRVDESSFFAEENGFCAWAKAKMEEGE